MKFLFDFFPVIIFYITYTISKRFMGEVDGMVIATAMLIAATCVQVAITWLRQHKVEKMHIIVLVLAAAALLVTGIVMLLALALPYSPLAGLLGFRPLQPVYLLAIVIIMVLYFLSAEFTKRWFFSRYLK